MGNLNKDRRPKRMDAFLAAYSECGNITEACSVSGVARPTHYHWMHKFDWYPPLFEASRQEACDGLEKEARRRAIEGVPEEVYHNGVPCGSRQRYSDTLLIFLMKGAMPEKYRERIDARTHSEVVQTSRVIIELPDNGREPNRLNRIQGQNGNGKHP